MDIRVTPRRLALALSAFALVLLGGVAYAAIPDGAGVIHGCIDRESADRRTWGLRVYDTAQRNRCPAGMDELDWNQTGPPGAQGAQGPQGPAGPAGPQGPPGIGGMRAFARINASGGGNVSTTEQNSKGLGSATISNPQPGVFCIGNLPFQPRFALGTVFAGLTGGVSPAQMDTIVTAAVIAPDPNFLALCDQADGAKTTQVRIYVYSTQHDMLVDRSFFIGLDD